MPLLELGQVVVEQLQRQSKFGKHLLKVPIAHSPVGADGKVEVIHIGFKPRTPDEIVSAAKDFLTQQRDHLEKHLAVTGAEGNLFIGVIKGKKILLSLAKGSSQNPRGGNSCAGGMFKY